MLAQRYPLRPGHARKRDCMLIEDLERVRHNAQERDAFLARLLQSHNAAILSVVTRSGGPEYLNLIDEARQAFLITANRALDTAREQDDGRGHNDPEAWCAWRGMLAVREVMRKRRGRGGRASIKQHAEARTIYTGAFSELVSGENEGASLYYADPNDYADEACANIDFTNFLAKLRGIDREVALLLVYGESETHSLTCSCPSPSHSYIQDIARAIDSSETRVFKILRRLRDAASKEFQQVAS